MKVSTVATVRNKAREMEDNRNLEGKSFFKQNYNHQPNKAVYNLVS
jgi:hypothetical protein